MKICIFISSIDKTGGGPSRSVPILVKGLAEIGCDVTLVTVESEDMNSHILDNSNAKIITLNQNYNSAELESILVNSHFDIIHGQGIWLPIYHKMAKLCTRNNIPFIMTPRGALEPWCLREKACKKKLALLLYQKRDLQKAAAILTTAEMEAEHLRDLGITSPLAIIPNGIDTTNYPCRSVLMKEHVKKQIVFISRIHYKKGIEFLIDAWEQLHTKYPDWTIKIAGNGEEDYITTLQKRITQKRLDHKIQILPPVFGDDKYKLYSESSLFVLPSFSENFGMVIAEAMSCGVPVITTTGTPWQELNSRKLGWCIDLSLENLTQTLSAAIDMGQEKLFDIGQQGSKYIQATYNYLSVAEKNKQLYEWIINKQGKPEWIW